MVSIIDHATTMRCFICFPKRMLQGKMEKKGEWCKEKMKKKEEQLTFALLVNERGGERCLWKWEGGDGGGDKVLKAWKERETRDKMERERGGEQLPSSRVWVLSSTRDCWLKFHWLRLEVGGEAVCVCVCVCVRACVRACMRTHEH